MSASWALTPSYFILFGLLCGVVGFRVGWRIGNRIALPIVEGASGWGAFLIAWMILGPVWAAASVGAWAFGTTVASIYVFIGNPIETDRRVMRAAPYRVSMLAWLQPGDGPERRPVATTRRHLREAIWYTAAGIATANLGSIAMGAILLNVMNAYVATLWRAATRKGILLLLAWNVWSVVRVLAYVVIGTAAASPLLRFWRFRADPSEVRALALAGAMGLVLDLCLKLALSRVFRRALVAAIDLPAAAANRSSETPLTLHLE